MNKEVFPKDIIVKNKADKSKYPFVLEDDFIYRWNHKGLLKGYENKIFEIKVPKGYETDFGSVPRPFQAIFNAVNDISPAAIAHDWCYSVEIFERHICDKVFYDGLRDNNVGWLRAQTLYRAVRLGGWIAWPHDPKEMSEDRELYRARFGDK
jgi:hypothetical protein